MKSDSLPTFEESTGHIVLQSSPENPSEDLPEDAPPGFSPYEAEFTENGSSIVSHDPHLNEDGEALYRFLLSQSAKRPEFILHCRGSHTETRSRLVTRKDSQGHTTQHTETDNVVLIDFDFYVDAGQHIVVKPSHWSVADDEAAYRGRMMREIELPDKLRRKATKKETSQFKAWSKERDARGFPPWISRNQDGDLNVDHESRILRSSHTLREWADEYCASKKHLKEFSYEKTVYGWDLDSMEVSIRDQIASTGYYGTLHVHFYRSNHKIYIRPDNRLARMISNRWTKLLLIILLVYPFIWLFKRFHSRGGGRWEVCGGAYALKKFKDNAHGNEALSHKDTNVLVPDGFAGPSSSRLNQETHHLGLSENEWLEEWKQTIRGEVIRRTKDKTPMKYPHGYTARPNFGLDDPQNLVDTC